MFRYTDNVTQQTRHDIEVVVDLVQRLHGVSTVKHLSEILGYTNKRVSRMIGLLISEEACEGFGTIDCPWIFHPKLITRCQAPSSNHTRKPRTDRPELIKLRKCLSCGCRFMSAGPQNRMCPDCLRHISCSMAD